MRKLLESAQQPVRTKDIGGTPQMTTLNIETTSANNFISKSSNIGPWLVVWGDCLSYQHNELQANYDHEQDDEVYESKW